MDDTYDVRQKGRHGQSDNNGYENCQILEDHECIMRYIESNSISILGLNDRPEQETVFGCVENSTWLMSAFRLWIQLVNARRWVMICVSWAADSVLKGLVKLILCKPEFQAAWNWLKPADSQHLEDFC